MVLPSEASRHRAENSLIDKQSVRLFMYQKLRALRFASALLRPGNRIGSTFGPAIAAIARLLASLSTGV